MDGTILLAEAEAAGLSLEASCGNLRIHGPESAEPLIRRLAAHKTAVLMALSIESTAWQTRVETIGGAEYDVTVNADNPAPGWHEAIEPMAVEVADAPKPRRRRAVKQAANLFNAASARAREALERSDER